ncbi:hypothetical protein RND81_03G148100 [Saponaria officinalis]|uniref:DUF1677 family protein n=1 Tax=Saponaria officinalis TaxID=3572 RepID=A0AAW1M981_SAPOF
MDDRKLRKAISDISLQISETNIDEIISPNNHKESIKKVKCECCGLEEECSSTYLNKIKNIHFGSWVCGLCSEAIKERLIKSSNEKTMKDALKMHKEFCEEFNASTRSNPKLSLTLALRDIAKRSSLRRRSSSMGKEASSGSNKLARSASCAPRIDVGMGGKGLDGFM